MLLSLNSSSDVKCWNLPEPENRLIYGREVFRQWRPKATVLLEPQWLQPPEGLLFSIYMDAAVGDTCVFKAQLESLLGD